MKKEALMTGVSSTKSVLQHWFKEGCIIQSWTEVVLQCAQEQCVSNTSFECGIANHLAKLRVCKVWKAFEYLEVIRYVKRILPQPDYPWSFFQFWFLIVWSNTYAFWWQRYNFWGDLTNASAKKASLYTMQPPGHCRTSTDWTYLLWITRFDSFPAVGRSWCAMSNCKTIVGKRNLIKPPSARQQAQVPMEIFISFAKGDSINRGRTVCRTT